MLVTLSIWALGEAVWVVFLGGQLPTTYVAAHWDTAWVGLDIAQIVAMVLALCAGWRRSRLAPLFIINASTLMLADVWFDITTARVGGIVVSVCTAGIEVPFAVLLWVIAVRALSHHAPQRRT
jgi:hypothetical protein